MGKKEEQINTNKAPAKNEGTKDAEKKNVPKNDKGQPLSEQDIMMYKRYGKGPYNDALKKVEDEIKSLNQKITELGGIKETDTGLAPRALWNLEKDSKIKESAVAPRSSTQAPKRPSTSSTLSITANM